MSEIKLYKLPDGGFLKYKITDLGACIMGCESVTGELKLPTHIDKHPVVSIVSFAFKNNTSITSVSIPNTIQNVGQHCFEGSKLESLNIDSNSLISIGNNAFNNCKNLLSVSIQCSSDGCHLGEETFLGCTNLKSVILSGNINLSDSCFEGCINLENVTISEGIFEIPVFCFSGCSSLKSINFPQTLENINEGAFYQNHSLTCVDLSNTKIDAIDAGAFTLCSSLKKMILPKTLSLFYKSFISKCDSLEEIIIDKDNPKFSSQGCFIYNNDRTTIVLCSPGYKEKNVIIPSTINKIEFSAFSCCDIESVVIPDSVLEIETAAFSNCKKLKEVLWSSSVKTIFLGTFLGCSSLTNFVVPEGVQVIDTCAFSECHSLKLLSLPSTIIRISDRALDNIKPESVRVKYKDNDIIKDWVKKHGYIDFGSKITTFLDSIEPNTSDKFNDK